MNSCEVCHRPLGYWITLSVFERVGPWPQAYERRDVRVCSEACQAIFEKWIDMRNDMRSGRLRV